MEVRRGRVGVRARPVVVAARVGGVQHHRAADHVAHHPPLGVAGRAARRRRGHGEHRRCRTTPAHPARNDPSGPAVAETRSRGARVDVGGVHLHPRAGSGGAGAPSRSCSGHLGTVGGRRDRRAAPRPAGRGPRTGRRTTAGCSTGRRAPMPSTSRTSWACAQVSGEAEPAAPAVGEADRGGRRVAAVRGRRQRRVLPRLLGHQADAGGVAVHRVEQRGRGGRHGRWQLRARPVRRTGPATGVRSRCCRCGHGWPLGAQAVGSGSKQSPYPSSVPVLAVPYR